MAENIKNIQELFNIINRLSAKNSLIIAIEGGSASGKTTLAKKLQDAYDCNVLHMDDFFLRPEQRTPQRLDEIGGNVDRERFQAEVLESLKNNQTVRYRRYDCSTQTLSDIITLAPKKITIVEGAYSMHLEFGKYYDFSVFLDIDCEYQKERILARSPQLASRFLGEWIPLENKYFVGTDIKRRVDAIFFVKSESDK